MFRTAQRVLCLLLFCLVAGQAFAQFSGPLKLSDDPVNLPAQITTDPAILFPPMHDIRLEAGDTISVTVYGSDYAPTDKVSLQGYLRLPLIGPVQVEGLSPHEAEQLIASKLESAGMFNSPQVTVTVTDSSNQIVTIIGEMHGVMPMLVPKKLFAVLSAAGGLPPTASRIITINRPGIRQPIVVDLGNDPAKSEMANIPVFAGDTIVVSQLGSVYLIGALHTQRPVQLIQNTSLTVMQAVSIAGGLPYEAKSDDTIIIRTEGTRRVAIPIHLKKIMKGQEADPVLQADDIVLVPTSSIRAAIHSGGLGTLLGVSSILVTAILYAR